MVYYVHDGTFQKWVWNLIKCRVSYAELIEWSMEKLEKHMDLYIEILTKIQNKIKISTIKKKTLNKAL